MIALRPYQAKAIDDLRAAYARGKRSPCLVIPTGGGKTIIAVAIILSALDRGKRVLFLAHRKELIDQTVEKLIQSGLAIDMIRVIRGAYGSGRHDAPVVVASVPTLTGARWEDAMPPADLVVHDELHHVVAASFRRVVNAYPHAHFLGLTATPCRSDGRSLSDVCDSLVVGPSVRELTAQGHLVPCRVWSPARQLNPGQIAQDPLDAYREHGAGGRAVVFCRDIVHAEREAERFGCPAVHGKVRDRGAILAAFARGEHQVITSVGVLTEGWDDPGCSVAILARSIGHVGMYLQICGRVLRPAPGKTMATVIDLHGSVKDPSIGPPDLDRIYSLDGDGIQPAYRDPIRQCAHCGSVFPTAHRCPYCGIEIPIKPLAAPKITGDGLELVSDKPSATRVWYERIEARWPGICASCRMAFSKGTPIVWAKGYARHQSCPTRGEAMT